jgi:hypothetical protein
MALYGEQRDISLFRHLNRELLNRIIEQKVGYYKINLNETNSNIYGESTEKFYNSPVLANCLIERGDTSFVDDPMGTVTSNRTIVVRFFRDDLAGIEVTDFDGNTYNILPEIGDIMLWNEDYFEIDNINENQLFVGKDPIYSYDPTVNNFGTSLSIICSAHHVRPEKLGLKKERL